MSKTDKPVNLVPMPSFTDPNRPEAANGSVNHQFHEAVVEHDKNYGVGRNAVNVSDDPAFAPVEEDADSRAGWSKADWRAKCEEYGLPVSGNLDELQARVEEYEFDAETNGGNDDNGGN